MNLGMTECLFASNAVDNSNPRTMFLKVRISMRKRCNFSVRSMLFGLVVVGVISVILEWKLVWFVEISVEEHDSFGGGVVDADYLCCLRLNRFTYLINNFWCRTRVSRWNFFCCVTLLYLYIDLQAFMLKLLILFKRTLPDIKKVNNNPRPLPWDRGVSLMWMIAFLRIFSFWSGFFFFND